MPNIYKPEFEDGERPEGFKSKRARLGYELATELIGCSVWEVPPRQAAYPYHYHYADEELLIVLEGEPSLRTSEGTRTEKAVALLAVSSHGRPDVIVYPDGNKIGVGERLPEGGGLRAFFKREDAVDYFEGERFPPEQG
jgi:uncharacterized cupin superfamily protein